MADSERLWVLRADGPMGPFGRAELRSLIEMGHVAEDERILVDATGVTRTANVFLEDGPPAAEADGTVSSTVPPVPVADPVSAPAAAAAPPATPPPPGTPTPPVAPVAPAATPASPPPPPPPPPRPRPAAPATAPVRRPAPVPATTRRRSRREWWTFRDWGFLVLGVALILLGIGLGSALIIPGFLAGTLIGAACLRQVDWDMTGPRSLLKLAGWSVAVLFVCLIAIGAVTSFKRGKAIDAHLVGTWEMPETILRPKPGSRLPATMRMILDETLVYRDDGTFETLGRIQIGWEDESRGRLKFSFTADGTWERQSSDIATQTTTRSVLIDPDSAASISMNGVTFDSRETRRSLRRIEPNSPDLVRVVAIDEGSMEVRPKSDAMAEMRPRKLVYRRSAE